MIFPLTLNQVKNFLREHKEGFSDYTARDNSYDIKLLNAKNCEEDTHSFHFNSKFLIHEIHVFHHIFLSYCMMVLFYYQNQNALSKCFLIQICLLSWE